MWTCPVRRQTEICFFHMSDVRSFSKQFWDQRGEHTGVYYVNERTWRWGCNPIPAPAHSCGHFKHSSKEQDTNANFLKTSHMSWEPFDSNTVQGTSVSHIRIAVDFIQIYIMFSNVTTMNNEMVSAHTFWLYHKNYKTPQDRVTNAWEPVHINGCWSWGRHTALWLAS